MRKKRYLFLSLILLLGALFLATFALDLERDYSPGSSEATDDSKPCDVVVSKNGGEDFTTIKEALEKTGENKKICVKPGIYYEVITISKPGQILTAFDKDDMPIIDGDTDGSGDGYFENPKGNDISLSGGRGFNYGELVTVANKDITFSHFVVRNSRGDGISIHSDTNPLTNIHVHDNKVQYTMVNSITIHGERSKYGNDTRGTVIENNLLEYASQYPRYGGSNWPGSAAFCGVDDVLFKNNIIRYSWGDGLLLDCNWKRSNNVTVEGNIIYDTKVSMLYIHASDNAIVRNNIVFSTPSNPTHKGPNWSCLHLQAQEDESYNKGGGEYGITGAKVYNNLFWGCRVSLGISAQATNSYLRDVHIYNNTFVNNGDLGGEWPAEAKFTDVTISTQRENMKGKAESVYIVNNLFAHAQEHGQLPVYVYGKSDGVNFDNNFWSKKPTNIDASGELGGSDVKLEGKDGTGKFPIFYDPPTDGELEDLKKWFMIKEDSPARDKGKSYQGLSTDFLGKERDGEIDIGAYEYGTKEEKPPPKECEPKCSGKECGQDGCGGSCGSCESGFECESGNCKKIPSEIYLYNQSSKVCELCTTCDENSPNQCAKYSGEFKLDAGWNFISVSKNLDDTDTTWFSNQFKNQSGLLPFLKISVWDVRRQNYQSVVYDENDIWGGALNINAQTPIFIFTEQELSKSLLLYPHTENVQRSNLVIGWNSFVFTGSSNMKASQFVEDVLPDMTNANYSKVYISRFDKGKKTWETVIIDDRVFGVDFDIEPNSPYLINLSNL